MSDARPRGRVRWLLWPALALGILLALLARPALHLISSDRGNSPRALLPEGEVDDASRQNRTEVAEVWEVPSEISAAEAGLAALLARARKSGLGVSIAGARHTMGGHTIHPGGIAIDMRPLAHFRLDAGAGLLHAGSGALWSEVIPFLDSHGLSVAVMQSNHSFTVGGSLGVNCHGWQFGCPPIASTVESIRLMKADGEVVRCSRAENEELFSLALGGYGLFGIILEASLRVVPNERYRLEQLLVPAADFPEQFDLLVEGEGARLAFCRLDVRPERFLETALITAFIPEAGEIPPLSDPKLVRLRRAIFRGSAGSEYGKDLRWFAETRLQPHLIGRSFSRNQLLDEPVEVFENRSADSVDILQEYFIPLEEVDEFLARAREIIPRHRGDLLNVTVRDVRADEDTVLRYADRRMLAFVLLFQQPLTGDGDATMQGMTRELIDAALALGGRFYLPYRLHATPEQFRSVYPRAGDFFARKRWYDPDGLFQNGFYRAYGAREQGTREEGARD